MIKTNLPVILLKGIVLLPNNELRLEIDGSISKNIIDVAELFHDNNILVVSQLNPLEEMPDLDNLPKIGVIAKISNRLELPNGKIRIILSGINRAIVHEYLNVNKTEGSIESIVSSVPEEEIEEKMEKTIIKKIYRELDKYIKTVPYMSNSILSIISNVTKLTEVTDIIAPNLSISYERMYEYLEEVLPSSRAEMILKDIYSEKETFDIERDIEYKVRQEIDNNQKEYILREKIKKIKEELGETSNKENEIDDLKEKINKLEAPAKIKERLNNELHRYEMLSQLSPEVNIVRNYIDWLLDLPWTEETIDNDDLKDVRKSLDKSHYGLTKVKNRIIEYLAVKQQTNSLKSPIICLVGPPGTGKTTLAFSIAEAINRNFVKMSVGGVNDEAEIVGHRRTYLGANPGRIIQSMKKAKSINPVFLIDEVDKMTKDIKGDPASALLEVLDPEQNKFFSDNYIEEEYDLSKVMFIATANYIENIPEPLLDRMEIIKLSGYTEYEKVDIAKKHLIPKICKEHGIPKNTISFNNKVLLEIIRSYTKEAGVRDLERQLSTIIRKYITTAIVKGEHVEPYKMNPNNLEKYLGKPIYHYNDKDENNYEVGVVTGLAYTTYGGDTLPIEVNFYKGTGELVLTGSLGDVMIESAKIALSYIKAHYEEFGLDYDKLTKNDIHIHVPEGAIKKDGPSAGIALTTALISAIGNYKIDTRLAMTGEITLRGKILPIGGLKEKSIGAHRSGIKKIIIPYDNIKDLDEVPKEIKKDIKYIPVKHYEEVFKEIKSCE